MKKTIFYLTFFLAAIITLNSCNKDDDDQFNKFETSDYTSDVVLDWIDLTLQLTEETPGYTPPVAARVYGYSGLALYESVKYGMPGYKSLEGQLTDFEVGTVPLAVEGEAYHWGAVANATLGVFIKSCFQTTSTSNLSLINNLETQYENQFRNEATDEIIDRSIEFGESVANAVLTFANSDGQAECYNSNFPASYVVPTGSGLWEPTSPNEPIPLQPFWGEVRPFLLTNSEFLPAPPPTYSTDPNSDFYLEAVEVYEAVLNLTPEQKVIAEFWSDDPGNTATPPGQCCCINGNVLFNFNTKTVFTKKFFEKFGEAYQIKEKIASI